MTLLIDELLERGHEFSFVQVMRLARRYLDPDGEAGIPGVPWQERVRIRPELSLAFPAADVAKVERNGDNLEITATFLGLYGPASPLPTFYTEDLMNEASGDESAFRDFLDIIHQRLYQLWFQCWGKYRLSVRVVEEQNPADIQRLHCLLGQPAPGAEDPLPLARYSGLFTLQPRPVDGLETLLRDSLGIRNINVVQCVKRIVPIPESQQMRLDTGSNTLDVDAVLGPSVEDRMGKMRIRIGPLSWDDYNSLLPGTARYERLAALVARYLLDPLEVDLELVLAAGEARHFELDDPRFIVGHNTFIFDDTMPETGMEFPLPIDTALAPAAPAPIQAGYSFRDYYQQERARIDGLAARYCKEHPAAEPLMADHSVERLFEGTAFLCGLLQMKLDDDLPEIIHDVTRTTQPQYLCPVPACTIIAFTPKPNCTGTHLIPKGTEVASVPIDGTSCRFTTVYPVELHPLALLDASYSRPPGRPAMITLQMELKGMGLADWQPETVRLFLSGEFGRAADLYLLLTRHLRRIVIAPAEGGAPAVLAPSSLQPVGFNGEPLFPATTSGARNDTVREFSILPEKFLFLDLRGWEEWRDRGEGTRFEIRFELEHPPFIPEKVTKEDFTLFATPAVNVFPHKALPIILCDEETDYPVIPEGKPGHYEVYSIEKVMGTIKGTSTDITFAPSAERGNGTGGTAQYSEGLRDSTLRQGMDSFMTIQLTDKMSPGNIPELSVNLLCSNGNVAEKLRTGDVCIDTDNSPHIATVTNSKPVTKFLFETLGDNRLWRLFGMQFMNLRLVTAESLRSVLRLLTVSASQDYAMAELNERRIEGIRSFSIDACDRLIRQVMRRGWNIRIVLDPDCYVSIGDLYLFGGVLDDFLRGFVSETYFSRLIVIDIRGDVEFAWPAKMGRRPLV